MSNLEVGVPIAPSEINENITPAHLTHLRKNNRFLACLLAHGVKDTPQYRKAKETFDEIALAEKLALKTPVAPVAVVK